MAKNLSAGWAGDMFFKNTSEGWPICSDNEMYDFSAE
jgi:hypothetical protein